MALTADPIQVGDQETEIKATVYAWMNQMITDGTLDAADYNLDLGGLGIGQFRTVMNANFAQFNTDLTVAGMSSFSGGQMWHTLRPLLNANFVLIDAVVNP